MTYAIPPGKLKKPYHIAPFALDVSRSYLVAVGYPLADRLHRACHGLLSAAGFSDDSRILAEAITDMPAELRDDLVWFLNETTLLDEFSASRAVLVELDDRLNLHWMHGFGFEDRDHAAASLGEDAVRAIEAFVDHHVDLFWERDAIEQALQTGPLTLEDSRIVARYNLGRVDPSLTTATSLFAGAELLRSDLKGTPGLRLSEDAIVALEAIINGQLRGGKPMAAEPKLRDLLA